VSSSYSVLASFSDCLRTRIFELHLAHCSARQFASFSELLLTSLFELRVNRFSVFELTSFAVMVLAGNSTLVMDMILADKQAYLGSNMLASD
jgi:hypothetical protein